MAAPANREPELHNFAGLRVTVVGLGRFGGAVGAIRFLARRGARVTVVDEAPAESLGSATEAVADCVETCLFEVRPEQVPDSDLLVLSPAIRPQHWIMELARERRIPHTSEIELFCANRRGRLVVVTGSNGKSTTAAMVGQILRSTGRQCQVGGNIGGSLLSSIETLTSDDDVVLELSSFQLARIPPRRLAADVVVVTNFAPNHLDWHGSLDAYRRAKQRALHGVGPAGTLVTNADDADVREWATPGPRLQFGRDNGEDGVFLADSSIVFRRGTAEEAVRPWSLPVPGQHNQHNALAAAATAWTLGVDPAAIAAALGAFVGLPMRLQPCGTIGGRTFVNDSGATTPESTVEALRSFRQPLVLIAGGADKGVDLGPLATEAARTCRAAHWVGQTAGTLSRCAAEANPAFSQLCHDSLESAVRAAVDVSRPGDIVILSPGCASFGMYANYEQRGSHFDALVQAIGQETESSDG